MPACASRVLEIESINHYVQIIIFLFMENFISLMTLLPIWYSQMDFLVFTLTSCYWSKSWTFCFHIPDHFHPFHLTLVLTGDIFHLLSALNLHSYFGSVIGSNLFITYAFFCEIYIIESSKHYTLEFFNFILQRTCYCIRV